MNDIKLPSPFDKFHISTHARERFAERFPDDILEVTLVTSERVLFSKLHKEYHKLPTPDGSRFHTNMTIFYLNKENEALFIVVPDNKPRYPGWMVVRTVFKIDRITSLEQLRELRPTQGTEPTTEHPTYYKAGVVRAMKNKRTRNAFERGLSSGG